MFTKIYIFIVIFKLFALWLHKTLHYKWKLYIQITIFNVNLKTEKCYPFHVFCVKIDYFSGS